MTLATVTTSVSNSALTQASLKVVELVGAERPDLELIIWATVSATDEEVNRLVSDWAGGLPA